ncbi:MAG: hypothetical protein IJ735_01900 [Clostridia bacterium]|nr:hypothetical protein [Clostridia bacterium]
MSGHFSVLYFGQRDIRAVLFSVLIGQNSYYTEKRMDYDGFDEKGFKNPEDVFLKIERLVKSIEEDNGVVVKKVYCAVPSVFFRYGIVEKDIAIESGTVTEKDIDALLTTDPVGLPSYYVAETLPLYYRSFNNPVIQDPVGQVTDRLYATVSCGYLNSHVQELFDNCAKKLKKVFIPDSFVMLAAKRLDHDYTKGVRRTVVVFCEGHTDVAICEGAVPVDVRSVPWGESSIREGIKELVACDEKTCDMIMKRLNLNLACADGDVYRLQGKEYSVEKLNGLAVEAVDFFAGQVKSLVSEMTKEDGVTFMTGSAFCANRGVKELFEDTLGKDVFVASSSAPHLQGCENYVLSAYTLREEKTGRSAGSIFKIFNRRK